MLVVMANASLSPALPQLRAAFTEASDLQVRMILTLPALVIVLASPLAGWTADRFGRKPLLILSALLYGLAGSSATWRGTLASCWRGGRYSAWPWRA